MKITLNNMTLPTAFSFDGGGAYHENQLQLISVVITDPDSPVLFYDHLRMIPGSVPAVKILTRHNSLHLSPSVIAKHVLSIYNHGGYDNICPSEFEMAVDALPDGSDQRGQCGWIEHAIVNDLKPLGTFDCGNVATRAFTLTPSSPELGVIPCCANCAAEASRLAK